MKLKKHQKIAIVMGSQSDFSTMKDCVKILKSLKISFDVKIVSAHRTPKLLYEYADQAASKGIEVIIAGAGGAAHLPGMTAAISHLPVIGVPIQTKTLDGLDSLLSINQMPKGVPVGTLAIGAAGAENAALLAVSILSTGDKEVTKRLEQWRSHQTDSVADIPSDDVC